VALGPASIPRLSDVGIDWQVMAFAGAVSIATSVLFGLVPALASTTRLAARSLAAGRGSIGGGGTRVRKVLVVCEMALAVMLLVGAGLLMRSYQQLNAVEPGFAADHILTFSVAMPEAKYPSSQAVRQFVSGTVERLSGTPGVEHAAAVFGLPLADDFSASSSFTKPGEADSGDSPSLGMRIVTPDYFRTLKIPLRAGRYLDARDNEAGPEAVMINEEAARRYWPNEDPIGKQLKLGVRLVRADVPSGQKTIVGVVGNVKYGGLDLATPPEVYLPHAQHPVDALTIAVRTTGDPLAFVPQARAALAGMDRELPMADIRTMLDIIGRSVAERRFVMLLLAAFAAVAVTLAAIGVYGVLAYVVSQRTQEIGVRLAIGAAPTDVVRLFVREGAMLATLGLVFGLIGALAANRAMTSLLFGVRPNDPSTFAAVAGALVVVALAASYLPARRAARVDPMSALRTD
jgi:putative ABC transport system permease protein